MIIDDDDRLTRALKALRHAKLLALAAGQPNVATAIFNAMTALDQDTAYDSLLGHVLDCIEHDNGTLDPATAVGWLTVTGGDVGSEADVFRVVAVLENLVDSRKAHALPLGSLAKLADVADCLATTLVGPVGSAAPTTNRDARHVADRIHAIHVSREHAARREAESDARPENVAARGWDFFNGGDR